MHTTLDKILFGIVVVLLIITAIILVKKENNGTMQMDTSVVTKVN